MMLQRASPDDHGAAVARLTPKERECLDRWLGHATAKQMALELGITHHAVEKRLKSARAKLGVTTTLEAARLLAAAEGYGPTASQSSEVAPVEPGGQQEKAASPPAYRVRRRSFVIAGATVMSLIIFAAFALGGQSQPQGDVSRAALDRKVIAVIDRKDGKTTFDLDTALASAFGSIDKNKDKFIAGEELTGSRFQVTRTMIRKGETVATPVTTSLTDFDKDGDKRVSEAEFLSGMNSLTAPRR